MGEEKDRVYSKLLQISRDMGLPVKKVLDTLFVLRTGEPVDNNELLRKVGVSKNVLNRVKQSLASFLKPVSRNTQLTSYGCHWLSDLYEKEYVVEERLWDFLEDNHYKEVVSLLKRIRNVRSKQKREYDQFTATIESTARRASLLYSFGDVRGKRLLFLGDNDFTSVAVASFGVAKRVTVIDIDNRVLSGITNASRKYQLAIETLGYDARRKPSKALVDAFDVVFTDPPYTPDGIKLFVSRAVEFLDLNNRAGRVYVCYGNSDRAKERFFPIYETFVQTGLMIRWIFDKFNRYYGAESIGSASSLFITEVTPKTKPLIIENYEKPIYTNN